MRSTQPRRSALPSRRVRSHAVALAVFEALEIRQLMAAQVVSPVQPFLAHPSSPGQDVIVLPSHLNNPDIPGSVVTMQTNLGTIEVALTDAATPLTVKNFLNYVMSGAYNGTVFHRSANLETNAGGSPKAPADIVQGGGFKPTFNFNKGTATLVHIPTNAPVINEVGSEAALNVAGTIAMAKTSDPDSATSEFFFNIGDNPALDSASNSGGFTTFGHVIGAASTTTINKIATVPSVNLDRDKPSASQVITQLPVVGVPEADVNFAPIRGGNLITLSRAFAVAGMTYTAVSDNPTLVQPNVSGQTLSFSYATGKSGVANVTVTGTSFDGSVASMTITITVPPASGGLKTTPDTPGNVFVNTANTISPLSNDTDSASAINPATLTVTTQPAHGTAAVSTSTGTIAYTPTTGFTGADTFQYTVRNLAGQTSSATSVSFTVTAAPTSITIGTSSARSLKWTEPDGTIAHLAVSGGTASVIFASANVTTTTTGGVVTVTGSGATLSAVAITNAKNQAATLTITASGGTDGTASVGTITDPGAVASIAASGASLIGSINVGSLGSLSLAAATHAVIAIAGNRSTAVSIGTVADTSLTTSGSLAGLRTKQWVDTDGINDIISAASLGTLSVTGDFGASLALTSAGVDVGSASVGGTLTRGSWTLHGSLPVLVAKSAAAAWSMISDAGAGTLRFTGDMLGDVTAMSISTISVGGDLSSQINANGAFVTASPMRLGRLLVAGNISNSLVVSSGSIGQVSAKSISGSSIYAGVTSAISSGNELPTAREDLAAAATIGNVHLATGTAASPSFSNSRIAATNIGPLALGFIQDANGGALEGVGAVSFKTITGTLASTNTKLSLGSEQLTDTATLNQFLADKKITLNDFAIDIVP